jgi:Spy/CpxP family protein refolding chaperone
MRLWKALSCLVIAGALTFPVALAQDDTPAPKPGRPATTKAARAKDVSGPRMLVPADKIPSLTEEQRQKLIDIAAQAEKDKDAVMEKAREASMAVLTDAQREEFNASKRKAQEDAAAKKAERQKKKEERQKMRAEKAKVKGAKPTKPTDETKPAEGAGSEQPK